LATFGGGISNVARLMVDRCTLSFNLGGSSAGGIYNAGWLTLSNTTIATNISHGTGAGLVNYGTAILRNCPFSSNSRANIGGAIPNGALSALSATNCTFVLNVADYGGAIYNSGSLTMNSCTVWQNSATIQGGGIDNAAGSASVMNTIVANNTCFTG